MMMSFSGSFHLVVGLMAFQRYQRPKPRPPMKMSFISCVTVFSDTFNVVRSMWSVRLV